jgi:hypothetical protein
VVAVQVVYQSAERQLIDKVGGLQNQFTAAERAVNSYTVAIFVRN